MPKIELQTPLLDPETDQPMVETLPSGATLKITLRIALKRSLATSINTSGQPISDDEKIRNYDLWVRIKNSKADVIDLCPEDIVTLRKVALGFPTLLAGQVRALLG